MKTPSFTSKLICENDFSVSVIKIAKFNFLALNLPLSALGLEGSSIVSIDCVLRLENEHEQFYLYGGRDYADSYSYEDFSFEVGTLESFEFGVGAKIKGIESNGSLLVKDEGDYTVLRVGVCRDE